MALYTPCPDVRVYLRLNITSLVYRSLTTLEVQSSIAWSILFSFIFLSNGLIFGLIIFKKSLRRCSNDILASLCFANILYGFAYVLPAKMMVIGNSLDPFRNGYCQLSSSTILFAFTCIINFHICSMGLEKLIAITKSTWHHYMSTHRIISILIMVFIIWCLPIFFAFFPLIIGWWRLCPYFCLISAIRSNNLRQELVAWHMSWSFLTFLLPTCITIVLYTRIVCVSRKFAKRLTGNKSNETSSNPVTKVIIAVAVIVGVYLLLQTPYNIFQIINVVNPLAISRSSRYILREWLLYAASWNSVTSPLIFAYYDRPLRLEIIAAIKCKCFNSKSVASPNPATTNAITMESL